MNTKATREAVEHEGNMAAHEEVPFSITGDEEAAVTAWCEKHSYKPAFVFHSSIDCWS